MSEKSAILAYGSKNSIQEKIVSGVIDENDIVFTQDTAEIFYIDDNLNLKRMRSRIDVFESLQDANNALNHSATTYDGQIVSIKNSNVYDLYVTYRINGVFTLRKLAFDNDLGSVSSVLVAHAGDTIIHVTQADKDAWNAKANAQDVAIHTNNGAIHVTAENKNAWDNKVDANTFSAHADNTGIHVTNQEHVNYQNHIANSDIHITPAEKQTYNAHVDDASIHITADKKQTYDNHVGNNSIHVTLAEKNKWNMNTVSYDSKEGFVQNLGTLVTGTTQHVYFPAAVIKAVSNNKITSSVYGLMCRTSSAYFDLNLYADGYLMYMMRVDDTGSVIRISKGTMTTI